MSELLARRWFRILLGVLSFVGTVVLSGYQRRTGPTWPITIDETLVGSTVSGQLPRSHAGDGDTRVSLVAPEEVGGEVLWRRYPTNDEWNRLPMTREGQALVATLPHQPPAGKLAYSVRLSAPGVTLVLPADESAVIRFRGDVPAGILIPHILFMFVALALVLRAAFGALLAEKRVGRFVPRVLAFLVPGGFILGPSVQKLAFGQYWTGWPFGGDWTDNKTLAALFAWIAAWAITRWYPQWERPAVLLAAAVMLAVYLIPHSVRGSELDWSQVETMEQAANNPGGATLRTVEDGP